MSLFLLGIVLLLIQYAAAVPWLVALVWQATPPTANLKQVKAGPAPGIKPSFVLLVGLGCAVGAGVLLGLGMDMFRDRATLEGIGQGYGSLLQLQIIIDLFVLGFALVLLVWPKGAAVARAAFREGYRQPMFWMLGGLAAGLIVLFPFVPYFTFGEDYIMMKELCFDTVMMAAVAFGVLAAAMSITEEIEGKTAVTLMSKPVSRRQFLLGKFLGIFLCCMLLVAGLGWLFEHVLIYKRWFERMESPVLAKSLGGWVESLELRAEGGHLVRGIMRWLQHAGEVVPGLVLSASLVAVLVAVAVSLATRAPMIINLVTCLGVYFLANLMPLVVQSTRVSDPDKAGPVQRLLHFTAQLFDSVLPPLEFFRVRPTLVDESTLPMRDYLLHVGAVTVYGVMFTTVVLLLGLVLFEDKDLA